MADEETKSLLEAAKLIISGHRGKTKVDPDDDYDDDYNDDYDTGKAKVPVSEMRRSSRARKKAEAATKRERARADALEVSLVDFAKKADAATALAAKDFDERLKNGVAQGVLAVHASFELKDMLKTAGIDDKPGQIAAQQAYDAIPEAGRPEFAAQVKLWQEKPKDAPKTLHSYLTLADKGGDIPNTGKNTGGSTGKKKISEMTEAEIDAAIAELDA